MSQYAPQPLQADGTKVEYRKAGSSDWNFIPGTGAVSLSGGEPTSNQTDTFEASFTTYGRATPPSVTIDLPGVQLSHSSYTDLVEAQGNGSSLFFRWRNPEVSLFGPTESGVTVAIATDGSITTAGTAGDHVNLITQAGVGPGSAIKIGTAYYVIKSIPANGMLAGATLTANPGSAVAAAVYSIVVPPVYQPEFSARINSLNVTRTAGAATSGSLTLGLISTLPAEKVGTP